MQTYEEKFKTDWLTMPILKTEDHLNRLDSGRDWVDYLTGNGWKICNIQTNLHSRALGNHEKVWLSKTIVRRATTIDMHLSYEGSKNNGSKFVCFSDGRLKNTITACDIENDPAKFAFLCDIMGWVSLKEANRQCKADTGAGLFESMAAISKPVLHA
jgi:hypothetical protein